jgi:uncharacterized pyridoxal phosphate-containing UPF0001 family protein
MSVAANLHRVQERIARAAERAGRKADEITLVGVTKYVGTQKATRLVSAGCHNLGESRPQELWKKAEQLPHFETPVRWHVIGHLQRNKVARTLPLVSLIHSVDSERLLAAINEAAKPLLLPLPLGEGRVARNSPWRGEGASADSPPPLPVLLEVNTSGEAAKHGLQPAEVEPLLAAAASYPHVAIRGLMTMAALEGGETVAARNFASLRELRDRLQQSAPPCVALNELSMGMSDDFEVAIQEGATIVRIGSLLWENVN